MYKINDYVMYGTTGVCQVIDIKKESIFNNMEKDYYVLSHIYSKDTIIKIPVENDKINIRKILTFEAATELICSMPNQEIVWNDDDRKRGEQFKEMLKTSEAEEFIKIVRSVYLDKENKDLLGKKASRADIEIMNIAERLLNEEFATVLNIPIEEVTPYILNNIEQ